MKTKAQKWGNSLAARVPTGVAKQAGVNVDDSLVSRWLIVGPLFNTASTEPLSIESIGKGDHQRERA